MGRVHGGDQSREAKMDGGGQKRTKFLKSGKIVIILHGKYAGRKAVIVKNYDDGSGSRAYGHCLVVGIDKYPLKVTKQMGPKKVAKRSKIKSFVKVANYNHIMPTRYSLDVDLKHSVTPDVIQNISARADAKKASKKILEERYATLLKTGKSKWFYQKLRF